MGATLTSSKILGVSFNSMHIEDGNLILKDQEITRKVTKIPVNDKNPFENIIQGDLHKSYFSMFGQSLVSSYTTGSEFLVNDVISFRSIEGVKINFKENIISNINGTFTNGYADNDTNILLKQFLTLLNDRFFNKTNRFIDYNCPSEDEYFYDFHGYYTIDDNYGKAFYVEKIEVNTNNPNFTDSVTQQPQIVESYTGAQTDVFGLTAYLELDVSEVQYSEIENRYIDDESYSFTGRIVGGNGGDFAVISYLKSNSPTFSQYNYLGESEFSSFNNEMLGIFANYEILENQDLYIFAVLNIDDYYNGSFENNFIHEVQVKIV